MKATIQPRESNKIASHRKENAFTHETAVLDPSTGRAIVTARYYGNGMTRYACVWISGNVYCRGAGKAGGGGYHKDSAAMESALSDAGVTLSDYIGGVGDSATLDALEAVARAVTGKRKFITHHSHA